MKAPAAFLRAGLRGLRHRLGRPAFGDFPGPGEVDRDRFARDMARPPAQTPYVMYFTPRSGSSWLADMVTRTRRLGVLGESFNPNFMGAMSRAMNATDLDEYCAVLMRRRLRDGVGGFQITHHQLRAVFGTEDDFLARFGSAHCFWLIRRDIVLQAISLFKMQQTALAHAPKADAARIAAAEAGLQYDRAAIRRWLEHILAAEEATEAMIARAGLQPLRMSYEHNRTLKPNHLLNVMARHMDLPSMRMKPIHSAHTKIATSSNSAFADRFRTEEADFLEDVAARRAPMLDRLRYYGPRRKPRADPAT